MSTHNMEGYRLTPQQRRLWSLQQADQDSSYRAQCALLIQGNIEDELLKNALYSIVKRHEILRTAFRCFDGLALPVQVITDNPILWREEYLGSLARQEQEPRIRSILDQEWRSGIDLESGSILKVTLITISSGERILLLTLPALCADRGTIRNLINEFGASYECLMRGEQFSEPELQYADLTGVLNELVEADDMSAGRKYWQNKNLHDLLALRLPIETTRRAKPVFDPRSIFSAIEPDTHAKIEEYASRNDTTAQAVLLACWFVLLWRYMQQPEILVGHSYDGRTYDGLEEALGLFERYLPIRSAITAEMEFSQVLKQIDSTLNELFDWQDYFTWEHIAGDSATSISPPHFSHVFSFDEAEQAYFADKLSLSFYEPYKCHTEKFKLGLFCTRSDQGIVTEFSYDASLFLPADVERFAGHFHKLLEGVLGGARCQVGQLEILTPSERVQLLSDFNKTEATFSFDKGIDQRFEDQVRRAPHKIAVKFEDTQLTYQELNNRANRLAEHLWRLGVGPETFVACCLERSLEMVVGLLGVLKAGGVIVPLDPSYPRDRLAYIIEDTHPPVLLTQERLVSVLPKNEARIICLDLELEPVDTETTNRSGREISFDNPAYAIYTSGSMGRPKGVMISHRSLLNRILWSQATYPLNEQDVILQTASPSFDFSVWEFFAPLLFGAGLVLPLEGRHYESSYLIELIIDEQATVMHFVPSMLKVFLKDEGIEDCTSLRLVFSGGEILPSDLARQFLSRLPVTFYNQYGPTEATIDATFFLCSKEAGRTVPIGKPIANTEIFLLDQQFQPAPINLTGELCIGGVGLARGYIGRSDLTADRFVPNPFSNNPGARLYRTGDLARYLPDGNIEFLGRTDHQVKIRGFRIELGDIESVLAQHHDVQQAIVLIREDESGNKQMIAYVVSASQSLLSAAELRDFVKSKLPAYMSLSSFVVLEKLPLMPSGKVDRAALASIEPDNSNEKDDSGNSNPIEDVIGAIWSEMLGVDSISRTANFFDLGGHSLLATQVITRIREAFAIEMPLRSIFESPTIAQLAIVVEVNIKKEQGITVPPILPVSRDEALPLSFAQQRLWFLDQLAPGGSVYNCPIAVRLNGRLDIHALERTITEMVRRHEVLRTTFTTISGKPVQVIASAPYVRIPLVDLAELESAKALAEANLLAAKDAVESFDLKNGPVFRATLLRLAADDHVVLFAMHHIVSDGWSLGVLVKEVGELYRAYSSESSPLLDELPVQYADYARWQREWLQGDVLDKQLSYWKQQLAAPVPVLELPADRPRPPIQSFRGDQHFFSISKRLVAELKALSHREGATLFMALMAAFKVLLSRYSGQEDILVGSPIAGRNHHETEGLIGFFVNVLVLRTDLSGNPSYRQLLNRVRETALGAYAHQDLPFEKLVEELQPERNLSHNPLFQVMMILQNAPGGTLDLGDLKLDQLEVETRTTKFSLVLNLAESDEGLGGFIGFNTDLFDRATVSRMAGHFLSVLEGLVDNPDCQIQSLPMLTEPELNQMLIEWSADSMDYPRSRCVHELFESQVEKSPGATALVFEGEKLTYSELNSRANQFASYLRELGIARESRVGICIDRSTDAIVAILGALKAGAAYVPLDPDYPGDRLAFMMSDAEIAVLVTQEKLKNLLESKACPVIFIDADWKDISAHSTSNLSSIAEPNNLAYLIYTSGSTGMPKAVMVEHRNLINTLMAGIEEFGISSSDTMPCIASFSFDISLFELWMPLLVGGTSVLLSRENIFDMKRLAGQIEQFTAIHAVPSLMQQIISFIRQSSYSSNRYENVRMLFVGGDLVPPALLSQMQEVFPFSQTHVLYGPTEGTIICSSYPVSKDRSPEKHIIGRPLKNATLRLLDKNRSLIPIGVQGEIYIGGDSVTRGYLNREEITTEKYVTIDGERFYKTGDLAKYLPDGNIEFLGRCDNQVKIRGFRIELGEIETVLSHHPDISEAVVIAREDAPGDRHLVAYVVSHSGRMPSVGELRRFLNEKVADYMLPAAFVSLDSLPLTANGKVDRASLPSPTSQRPTMEQEYVEPQTALQKTLAAMWMELIGIEKIGIDDNFFELGGDSIKAVLFTNKLQDKLSELVYVVAVFEAPTIASFAEYLEAHYQSSLNRLLGTELPHSQETAQLSGTDKVDHLAFASMREMIKPLRPYIGSNNGSQSKNARAVFVLSPPRSGSTLFRVMLAGHSRLFAPPELELLSFNTLAERKAAFEGKYGMWLEGTIRAVMEARGCSADEAKQIMEDCEEKRMTSKQFYNQLQQWIGDQMLVDKTPSYALDVETLRRAETDFDNPLYIHLLRHPCAMINSFEKARLDQVFFIRYKHSFAVRHLAELIWTISHQNILTFLSEVPAHRQHTIEFEKLIKEPEPVINNLCSFLGLQPEPGMIQPYSDKKKKMTDGIHPLSKMVGDIKFHEHDGIDSRVADHWRDNITEDQLSDETRNLAEMLGYGQTSDLKARLSPPPLRPKRQTSFQPLSKRPRGDESLDDMLTEVDHLSRGETLKRLS